MISSFSSRPLFCFHKISFVLGRGDETAEGGHWGHVALVAISATRSLSPSLPNSLSLPLSPSLSFSPLLIDARRPCFSHKQRSRTPEKEAKSLLHNIRLMRKTCSACRRHTKCSTTTFLAKLRILGRAGAGTTYEYYGLITLEGRKTTIKRTGGGGSQIFPTKSELGNPENQVRPQKPPLRRGDAAT